MSHPPSWLDRGTGASQCVTCRGEDISPLINPRLPRVQEKVPDEDVLPTVVAQFVAHSVPSGAVP
jgi:hypothetical protein